MIKTLAVFALLVGTCLANDDIPSCEPEGKPTVSASSSSSSNGGVTLSISRASAKVVEEARDALSFAIADSVNKAAGGGDLVAEAIASAKAVATAYVRINLNGRAFTTVQGSGEGCASAFAEACTSAEAVAVAVAQAFAESENDVAIATADSTADAVKTATLTVQGEITAEACSQGGFSEATQEFIGEQSLTLIAQAFVRAYATVGGVESDADSLAESVATATQTTDGELSENSTATVVGQGDADATASGRISVCDEKARECCGNRNDSTRSCTCGRGCFGTFPRRTPNMVTIRFENRSVMCNC